MRILITGNMGYVGPVLTRFLRDRLPDAKLIGFDTAFFGHRIGERKAPRTCHSRGWRACGY